MPFHKGKLAPGARPTLKGIGLTPAPAPPWRCWGKTKPKGLSADDWPRKPTTRTTSPPPQLACQFTSLFCKARATASERLVAPSLDRMLLTWNFTVERLTTN